MTEYEYLKNRIKDLLVILSSNNLPGKIRTNQLYALKFYVTELNILNKSKDSTFNTNITP